MEDRHSLEHTDRFKYFTLDQPVTRQIIAEETKLSYTTVCRKLREMDFVKNRGLICPQVYQRILKELGY